MRPLQQQVLDRGRAGEVPTVADVRSWHRTSLTGVRLAESWVAGQFRGEGPAHSRLRIAKVHVNNIYGTEPAHVLTAVRTFFDDLSRGVRGIDALLALADASSVDDVDDDVYEQVLHLVAWTHGQWVRIHPFVDHNGSTARLLTRFVAAHFGLPLGLPVKPRSDAPVVTDSNGLALTYGLASEAQMAGSDLAMVEYLYTVLNP